MNSSESFPDGWLSFVVSLQVLSYFYLMWVFLQPFHDVFGG